MPDMTPKIFEETNFGKAAMKKLGKESENFRLYKASRNDDGSMTVTGAEFSPATRGKNAGQLRKKLTFTDKTVVVSPAEIEAAGN